MIPAGTLGPYYAVAEIMIDKHGFEGCRLEPDDELDVMNLRQSYGPADLIPP
jgi:hypothetical protein